MSWYRRSWDMSQGKAKMRRLIRNHIQYSIGPVTVSELLGYLSIQGYHVEDTRRVLGQFVDVDDEGHVAMREAKGAHA
jgi:hypothetical protein